MRRKGVEEVGSQEDRTRKVKPRAVDALYDSCPLLSQHDVRKVSRDARSTVHACSRLLVEGHHPSWSGNTTEKV